MNNKLFVAWTEQYNVTTGKWETICLYLGDDEGKAHQHAEDTQAEGGAAFVAPVGAAVAYRAPRSQDEG